MCDSNCAPNAPDSFRDYSDTLRRHLLPAIVVPLIEPHQPDDIDDGAFVGTVGLFATTPAIVTPNGPWFPDYGGIVPVSAQQQIVAPEPWMNDDGES